MDLVQRKLTRQEWNTIEIPVCEHEISVLKMINDGYNNLNISFSLALSLIDYMKMTNLETIHAKLYDLYLKEPIEKINTKYNIDYKMKNIEKNVKSLKKVDLVRINSNSSKDIMQNQEKIMEFQYITIITKMFKYLKEKKQRWNYYYVSLRTIYNYNIKNTNNYMNMYIKYIIDNYENKIILKDLLIRSSDYIEKNEYIEKYKNITLYEHQKQIYSVFKNKESSKLVLYIAPTATGKTLTPIGLSNTYKVIFVCAARHVGIGLSRSAISAGKKIAFAFGCSCADDIRLHYFSGSKYVKRDDGTTIIYKDGSKKIDNSVGDKVEIMICDLQSYIYAMYYMIAFNKKENIITFWDEPTITLDYENHPCHEIINKNWKENLIPNIVLSSATLPKEHEINELVSDFRTRFNFGNIYSINSSECKRTIPIINEYGCAELPHYVFDDYTKIQESVEYISKNKTIMRYLDITEISNFIIHVNDNKLLDRDEYYYENFFDSIDDINMSFIKEYYLIVLKYIKKDMWKNIYEHFKQNRKRKIPHNIKTNDTLPRTKSYDVNSVFTGGGGGSLKKMKSVAHLDSTHVLDYNLTNNKTGTHVTTKDAFSLSSGPTIYLADDVDKIAKFCLQTSEISKSIMDELEVKLQYNNALSKKIDNLDKMIEDQMNKVMGSDDGDKAAKKEERQFEHNQSIRKMSSDLEKLRKMMKNVVLPEEYVPNKLAHLKKWCNIDEVKEEPFCSKLQENEVIRVMELNVENIWKVLLLMGIGLFSQNMDVKYTEIVKEYADAQKLYLIIANGDYIYGTNYQFCHGYIGKDISHMTQEKLIQAMGRIGRNSMKQGYDVRFRDINVIPRLFLEEQDKIEVKNMNKLFNSDES